MQRQFRSDQHRQGGIIGFVMRIGLARDEKSARRILGITCVVVFAFVGYLLFAEEEQAWDTEYAPDTEYGGRELPDDHR